MNDVDGKIVIGTELETKKFDAQIEQLEKELEIMQKTLDTDLQMDLKFRLSQDERLKLESDIEKTKNRILSLREAMVKVEEESDDMGKKISMGFQKGTKNLKRFALSLFGIQSIYRLVSKASSAYISQDAELAQKLQNVWIGLGSFLAPAIELISNALSKGLGYLNEFIKALTGIDFIARANAKALEKQATAQKMLNNQTYDFDIIRKQQSVSSGSASSTNNLIDIPKLDDKVVNKLREMATSLKDNWYWIKEVGKVLLLTFGAVQISKVLGGIGSLIGSSATGTGLTALLPLLTAIAGIWTITLLVDGYKQVKEQLDGLNEQLKGNTEGQRGLTESTKKVIEQYKELERTTGANEKQFETFYNWLGKTTLGIEEQAKALENDKTWWGEFTGANKEITKQQEELAKQLFVVADAYENLYKQGKITDQQFNSFTDNMLEQIKTFNEYGIETKELTNKLISLTNKKYNIDFYLNAKDNVSSTVQDIAKKISSYFGGGLSGLFGSGGGGKAFAMGGIVTQPTRALIGEAGYPEAVVPMTADYLSTLASEIAKYGGNGGNQPINVYLDGSLIQRQIDSRRDQRNFTKNN